MSLLDLQGLPTGHGGGGGGGGGGAHSDVSLLLCEFGASSLSLLVCL
jgi:hypothetical protein